MQPKESIKTISYLGKSVSRTHWGKLNDWHKNLFVEVQNRYIISMSPLRKPELPTKSQLYARSLSTTFLTPLVLPSFLTEAKHIFTNFPTAHHNLGSSRVTASHLGGFTSKSNKCHKDCFTKLKCSNRSQRGICQPKLGFITNYSNLIKWCWGELIKALAWVFSLVEPAASKGGRGKDFILVPQKLAIEN
jgi:hypothetical protein